MGFLEVRFELEGREGVKLPLLSTHRCLVSENIPLSTSTSLILLMSAFFNKKTNLVTGPSFMSIAGSGVITIFIYKVQWLSLLNNFF